ncbi:hypothetical protein ON010_g9193 [Phytophthora cinnamomi]|nr:hypothetical protein ON010_g9193 [Phytophthora cinnamomi]
MAPVTSFIHVSLNSSSIHQSQLNIQSKQLTEAAYCESLKRDHNRFTNTQSALLNAWLKAKTNHYLTAAQKWGLKYPAHHESESGELDYNRIKFDSAVARRSGLQLSEFVRLWRGQTDEDGRPNKSLYELPLPTDPHMREFVLLWNDVVKHGVQPQWTPAKPVRQAVWPRNHSSVQAHLHQIRRHVQNGHRQGRYLIVDEDLCPQWPEIFVSPIGVVDKSGGTDMRLINDYSYPDGASVNDFTDQEVLPPISYNLPADIARRLHHLRARYPNSVILMKVGDVAGAFRHVPVHENHVHMFVFVLDNHLVIDLSCGFGWSGSPAYYALAGRQIHSLYGSRAPHQKFSKLDKSRFGPNTWCDDHTCAEVDTGSRCFEANLALRHAMATVLGPEAVNEDKFTNWSTNTKSLGLLWNTTRNTVSIPQEKIAQARARILGVYTVKRLQLRLYTNSRRFEMVFGRTDARTSFELNSSGGIRSYFYAIHFRDMDASDTGLCALAPQSKQYLRLKFDEETRNQFSASKTDNSINARELLSAVLAALHWGPTWGEAYQQQRVHVRFAHR